MKRHAMLLNWRLTIVKILILCKIIYSFNIIPIEIPGNSFVDIQKVIIKWTQKGTGPRTDKTNLKKENKVQVNNSLFNKWCWDNWTTIGKK